MNKLDNSLDQELERDPAFTRTLLAKTMPRTRIIYLSSRNPQDTDVLMF